MKQGGSADLALMGGGIPKWLFERMTKLSLAIIESILIEKGKEDFLSRTSLLKPKTLTLSVWAVSYGWHKKPKQHNSKTFCS
jgi:hypothetical protein